MFRRVLPLLHRGLHRAQTGLGKTRIAMRIDVGFGDVIVPKPESIKFPPLMEPDLTEKEVGTERYDRQPCRMSIGFLKRMIRWRWCGNPILTLSENMRCLESSATLQIA